MDTTDEASAKKQISKYVVVLHELFKDHPERLGGFEELKSMMSHYLNIETKWAEENQVEFASYLKEVCDEYETLPELTKFGVDWSEAARGTEPTLSKKVKLY